MSQPPSDKVTLEDLLRLKRAERPPAEFWSQFDRELQAKQLAALVGKKRWWHSAARTIARFSYLPLGATAAMAFALIAAHQYLSPVAEMAGSDKLPAPAAKVAPAPAVLRNRCRGSFAAAGRGTAGEGCFRKRSLDPAAAQSHPAAPAATRRKSPGCLIHFRRLTPLRWLSIPYRSTSPTRASPVPSRLPTWNSAARGQGPPHSRSARPGFFTH